MARLGLQGAVRGGKKYYTTIPDTAASRPADLVNRQFQAERANKLWVTVFTCVAIWSGLVFVALVIDVFVRRIVGWRVECRAGSGCAGAGALGPLRHLGIDPLQRPGQPILRDPLY